MTADGVTIASDTTIRVDGNAGYGGSVGLAGSFSDGVLALHVVVRLRQNCCLWCRGGDSKPCYGAGAICSRSTDRTDRINEDLR